MSDMDDVVEIKTKGLDKLLKALNAKMPVARVGILGDSNARNSKDGSNSNATVGAAHEFGTSELPIRSFLRVPISEHLSKKMESSGALDKQVLKQVIAEGTVVPWLKKIATLAEGIVLEAFDTSGFGKWKPSNMDDKKNHQTLVETGQLRNAITSVVKE